MAHAEELCRLEVTMDWLRLTIRRLLLVIVYCGVGFAALHSPSWLWASVLFSIMVGALAAITLAAVYRRGERRAFWAGFAFCGWLYLVLSTYPWLSSNQNPFIITSALVDLAYPTITPPTPAGTQSNAVILTFPVRPAPRPGLTTESIWNSWNERSTFGWGVPEPYRAIWHTLLTPLFALLGGLWARRLYRTRDPAEARGRELWESSAEKTTG
jgi:hypothetical protein